MIFVMENTKITKNRELIRRMMIVVNRIDGIYERMAVKLGVKLNMICLLYALDDGSPHSQKQISEDWMLPRTTFNTITKECMKKGYVTLEPIPGKRREMNIVLTDSGRAYARKYLDEIYRAEEEAFLASSVGEDSIGKFEDFCERLKGSFDV